MMTLGKLIDELKKRAPGQEVRFDFAYMIPTTCHSYRGDYSQLAIGWKELRDEEVTVKELLAELEKAVGATFEGYKGGSYTMSRSTRIWVENWGEGSRTAISRIGDCDYYTIIETCYEDY